MPAISLSPDSILTYILHHRVQQTLFTGNVDYLGGVVDEDKRAAHLFVQQGRASVLYSQSRDGGLSWSPLTPMSSATLSIPVGLVAIPSVANGIQLRGDLCAEPTCGGAAGNLLMPFVCLQSALVSHASQRATWPVRDGGACAGCFSCVAVSEDRGATWNIAPAAVSAQQGTREASVVQLLSGAWPLPPRQAGPTVFVSERNMGATAPGSRLHALSVDGGRSFDSDAYGADPGLPDSRVTNWTGIVAGLTRFDSVDGAIATRRLVVSAPRSRAARADLALFTSIDEGRTWDAGRLWAPGPAGYSCVVQLNETSGAILFENGDAEFAQRISFQTFTAADLDT